MEFQEGCAAQTHSTSEINFLEVTHNKDRRESCFSLAEMSVHQAFCPPSKSWVFPITELGHTELMGAFSSVAHTVSFS